MLPKQLTRQMFTIASIVLVGSFACGQDRYPLLNTQAMPTGQAAQWTVQANPQRYGYFQPVQISLPSAGHVSFFQGSPQSPILTQAPSQAGMMVGHTYRVRISGMPEYPGVELYPTVEVLDRLHPPEGQAQNFPIPIEITSEEIEVVLQERMITKVVYLEQPDLAAPFEQGNTIHVEDLPVSSNLIHAADERGRPMVIIRMGGRIPDPQSQQNEFYSNSPLELLPHR